MGRGTAPAWLEHRTRDAFAAAIFYGEVLDRATEPPGCCAVAYEQDSVVLRDGNDVVALISIGAVDEDPDPQVRPRRHVRFRVGELEAAVAAATGAGGRIMSAVETSGAGRWVALSDPEGALFTVYAPLDRPRGSSPPDGRGPSGRACSSRPMPGRCRLAAWPPASASPLP
ncbi:VOC family protein [Streptomyces sp. NPDC057686]|uniref:VOC family protein n=1 Tax=Streptomyces sp. NPDC057686 TaxID=3346212 RepID=UPI0036C82D0A